MRLFYTIATGIFLLALVGMGLNWLGRKAFWRIRLLAWKLRGQLQFVSWKELFGMLTPLRSKPKFPPLALEMTASSRSQGPCPVLWDTALGPFWGRESDAKVLYETVAAIVEERGEPAVIPRDNEIVIDVGAHLGAFTRYALRRGARLVVAFEPEPINIAGFKRNFRREIDEGKVILVEAAAWYQKGELQIASGEDSLSWSFSAVEQLQSSKSSKLIVQATTIDEAVEELKLSKVDFIKMNIEGAERQALQGTRRTLLRDLPQLSISIHHLRDDLKAIPQAVLGIRPGYRVSFNANRAEAYFQPAAPRSPRE